MELIIIIILLSMTLIVLYFIFGINLKKIRGMQNNEKLDKLVNRFPENEEVCKQILNRLNNKKTKIKIENENKTTSLYVAISDTIFIGNVKDKYYRLQTIAHECLHSIQPRKLLLFNFIYSNIYIIYYLLSVILVILGVFKDIKLQMIILTILSFVYYIVRSYLEMDAMIKARYIAKDYMEEYIKENKICTKEEVEEVVNQYDKINQIGVPTYNYILLFKCIIKIIIFILIVIIKIRCS